MNTTLALAKGVNGNSIELNSVVQIKSADTYKLNLPTKVFEYLQQAPQEFKILHIVTPPDRIPSNLYQIKTKLFFKFVHTTH